MADCPPDLALESDDLDHLLGYQLRRLSVAVMADLTSVLAPIDLRPVEAAMLFLIGASSGITQSDLGRRLAIQRPNMAPLVGQLDRRGLIERARIDGRSHGLLLSADGEALRRKAWEIVLDHEDRMFSGLSVPQRRKLGQQVLMLRKTLEHMERPT